MKGTANNIFTLKISLLDTEPLIWRRLLIPEHYSLYDLHVAIQDAMGWKDSHLFQFLIGDYQSGRRIGVPDPDFEDETEEAWEVGIKEVCSPNMGKFTYEYDFGDSWIHSVEFEDFTPKVKGTRYPICEDGANTCPPEDCGGTMGFEDFKEAAADNSHEDHDSLLEWYGGPFDPTAFDASKIKFRNATAALKKMLFHSY